MTTQDTQAPTLDHVTKSKCRRIEDLKRILDRIPERLAPFKALEVLFVVLSPAVREEIALLTVVEEKMRADPVRCELERVNNAIKCAQNIYEALFEVDHKVLISEWFLTQIRSRASQLKNKISLEGGTLLTTTLRNFVDQRDGGKKMTQAMAARFAALAELITDGEEFVRDQCEARIDAVIKPAPPVPAKRDRKADQRERDRQHTADTKGSTAEISLSRGQGKKARKSSKGGKATQPSASR